LVETAKEKSVLPSLFSLRVEHKPKAGCMKIHSVLTAAEETVKETKQQAEQAVKSA